MEFWGIEVKPGKPLKVTPEAGKLIHISQASLGEVKDVKAAKNVPLRLKIDDKSFVFGYLSAEGTTQIIVDLVFEREFELSHDLKNGSVYFLGYTADEPTDDEEFSEFGDDSEDELLDLKENGNAKPNAGDVKAAQSILAAAAGNAKAEAKKDGPAESDDDDDDEDTSESDSDGEMALGGLPQVDSSDEDDSLDDDSSDEEELPKVQQSKKRPVAIEQKAPASKKAKSAATPPGNSGKKGQTPPIPSKAAGNKSKEQTPKSAGNKSKEQTPKSRNKGKHGGK